MESTVVIVVGAGPAGIATSASLTVHSIPHIILEKDDCAAPLWQKYSYDRLHLHLSKRICHLPYAPFPSSYPTFVPKNQYLDYLKSYMSTYQIAPRFRRNVDHASFSEDSNLWTVLATNLDSGVVEEYSSRFIVLATGNFTFPHIPDIKGLQDFKGEVIHSTQYKNGKDLAGKSVLVVGSGNSGMDVALDACNCGAVTSIVIRSSMHVVTRWSMRIGLWLIQYISSNTVDFWLVLCNRLVYGDLTKYGISRPKGPGPIALAFLTGKYPAIDVGAMKKIKSGEIQVLPAIESIGRHEVSFANGKSYAFDTIVLCTGFRWSLSWVPEDYLPVNGDGQIKDAGGSHWKGKNGLYCNGIARIGLIGVRRAAQVIAQDIKSLL